MYLGGVEDWQLKLEYSQTLTHRKYTKVPLSEYTNYYTNNKKTSKPNVLQIQSQHQKIKAFPIFIIIINMYK